MNEKRVASDRFRTDPDLQLVRIPVPFVRGEPPPPGATPTRVTPRPGSPRGRVVIIDDDSVGASSIADALTGEGHSVEMWQSMDDALARIERTSPDVIVLDPFALLPPSRQSGGSGSREGPLSTARTTPPRSRDAYSAEAVALPPHVEAIFDALRALRPKDGATPEIVVVTAQHDVEAAIASLHRGAADVTTKPVSASRLRLALARALEKRRVLSENATLKRDLALFAAAQRMLETLDETQLAAYGLDTLAMFTRASGGVLVRGPSVLAQQGLTETQALVAAAAAQGCPFRRAPGKELHAELAAFHDSLTVELGPDHTALLVLPTRLDPVDEEAALFLAFELGTAFRNGVRFAEAEREARRDSLTGLWNARSFHEVVEAQTAASQPFALLFLDIDHFKLVNDRHGHISGSRVLVELAEVLQRSLREGDIVARFGGDEFIALLPALDVEIAVRVAERVRANIAAHPFLASSGAPLSVTVSIGIAAFPAHGVSPNALLDSADRAMYVGKGAQRNAVRVAELPTAVARTRTPVP